MVKLGMINSRYKENNFKSSISRFVLPPVLMQDVLPQQVSGEVKDRALQIRKPNHYKYRSLCKQFVD